MKTAQVDVAVVGGGPAGMMASIAAASGGADVLLVDARHRLGGNYYKELPAGVHAGNGHAEEAGHSELVHMRQALMKREVPVLDQTTVWGIFRGEGPTVQNGAEQPFTLYLQGPHPTRTLEARTLIVAPGVYDRSLPFPGWTLPGIMSPGGAQLLLKNQGILPGRRVLVAGTGPLLMAVAAALAEHHAEVVALLDTASLTDGWRSGPRGLWGQWARVREAVDYWRILRRHHVPFRFQHAVFRALGDEQVEAAVIGQVDADGYPIAGTERTVAVDTICLGYGFLPLTALTLHLGCRHVYDPNLRTEVPFHDEMMATDVPGIFVAGDVTGVGGKDLARLQGHVAGVAACGALGYLTPEQVATRVRRVQPQIAREMRFRDLLWRRFRMRAGLLSLAGDDTIICRCEAARLDEIKRAIEAGTRDLKGVKIRTRVGMGPCQGRYCSANVAEIVAHETGVALADIASLKVRPPVMPIRIRDIVLSEE